MILLHVVNLTDKTNYTHNKAKWPVPGTLIVKSVIYCTEPVSYTDFIINHRINKKEESEIHINLIQVKIN